MTAESFLPNSVDQGIGHCLDLRMLARRMVHEPTISSFAICHEELTAQHIIVDDDFNIKGFVVNVSGHTGG